MAWQGTGANLMVPYWLFMLAEAYEKKGQIEEGLRLVAEALTLTDKQDERWWEAELSRIKGELILRRKGHRGRTLFSSGPEHCPSSTG